MFISKCFLSSKNISYLYLYLVCGVSFEKVRCSVWVTAGAWRAKEAGSSVKKETEIGQICAPTCLSKNQQDEQ